MNRDAGHAGSPRATGAAGKPPGSSAIRRSPVVLSAVPAATEVRDGWNVVLRYENEGSRGGKLRRRRLAGRPPGLSTSVIGAAGDFQDAGHRYPYAHGPARPPAIRPSRGAPAPRHQPDEPDRRVAIWHLGEGVPPATPPETPFTETTDGHCMLAFVGRGGPPPHWKHLTPLDLFDPARPTPFLTQGPVLHVPMSGGDIRPRAGRDDLRARLRGEVLPGRCWRPARSRDSGPAVRRRSGGRLRPYSPAYPPAPRKRPHSPSRSTATPRRYEENTMTRAPSKTTASDPFASDPGSHAPRQDPRLRGG